MCRNEQPCEHDRDDRERQRDQEHRSPVEMLQKKARGEGPEHGDAATDRGPQRNRLRTAWPRPQSSDQRQRGWVGHPCGQAAAEPCEEEEGVGGCERGEQRHRDCQRRSQKEHQLAPVAVAEGPQPQHRAREAEGIADCDQIERGLGGVEMLADVRQGDVGHGEVEVRDPRDDDQRDEDDAGAVRGARPVVSRARATACGRRGSGLSHSCTSVHLGRAARIVRLG